MTLVVGLVLLGHDALFLKPCASSGCHQYPSLAEDIEPQDSHNRMVKNASFYPKTAEKCVFGQAAGGNSLQMTISSSSDMALSLSMDIGIRHYAQLQKLTHQLLHQREPAVGL
jgi:hypothetical protein